MSRIIAYIRDTSFATSALHVRLDCCKMLMTGMDTHVFNELQLEKNTAQLFSLSFQSKTITITKWMKKLFQLYHNFTLMSVYVGIYIDTD